MAMPAIYERVDEGAGGPTVSAKDLVEAPPLEDGSITARRSRGTQKGQVHAAKT